MLPHLNTRFFLDTNGRFIKKTKKLYNFMLKCMEKWAGKARSVIGLLIAISKASSIHISKWKKL